MASGGCLYRVATSERSGRIKISRTLCLAGLLYFGVPYGKVHVVLFPVTLACASPSCDIYCGPRGLACNLRALFRRQAAWAVLYIPACSTDELLAIIQGADPKQRLVGAVIPVRQLPTNEIPPQSFSALTPVISITAAELIRVENPRLRIRAWRAVKHVSGHNPHPT